MKFARYTFLIAGIYGLIVLLPQYFLENRIGVEPRRKFIGDNALDLKILDVKFLKS